MGVHTRVGARRIEALAAARGARSRRLQGSYSPTGLVGREADRRAAHLALAARATDASESAHHLLEAGASAEAATAAERGATRAHRLDDAVAIPEGAIARVPATHELSAVRARLLVRTSEMLTHTEQSSRAEALALEAAELARGDAGDRGLGRTTVLSDEPGAPVRVIWVGGA